MLRRYLGLARHLWRKSISRGICIIGLRLWSKNFWLLLYWLLLPCLLLLLLLCFLLLRQSVLSALLILNWRTRLTSHYSTTRYFWLLHIWYLSLESPRGTLKIIKYIFKNIRYHSWQQIQLHYYAKWTLFPS